jgi:hypothetical protein
MSSLLVFNIVYSLDSIRSVILVFLPPLVNHRPSNLLTGLSPPSPSLLCLSKKKGYVFIQCITGGGGGVVGLCEEHLQELYTVYLTRFRAYKIAMSPQTKT